MGKFIHIKTGVVNKKFVTGVIQCKASHPWNGKDYYFIRIHMQGTSTEIEYDSKVEMNQAFDNLLRELEN